LIVGRFQIWTGKTDQPRTIGIPNDDEAANIRKLGCGDAVRKIAFVRGVSGTVPAPDVDGAEWTSGETDGAKRDASKRRQQYTRHFRHGNVPQRKAAGMNAITGCITGKENALA